MSTSRDFLDVELIKNKLTHNIDRNIYRKPCRFNNTISYNSTVPANYKKAAYRFYVKRAFEVCTEAYIEAELTKIKTIAAENGYPRKCINKVINEFKKRSYIKKGTHFSNFYSIDYVPQLYERIRYALKK